MYFFFFKQLYLRHMEVLRLGVDLELQKQGYPTAKQHWLQDASTTYTTAYCKAGSLTHLVRPAIKPVSSWRLHQVLHPLSHNGNSSVHFENAYFINSIIKTNTYASKGEETHLPSLSALTLKRNLFLKDYN